MTNKNIINYQDVLNAIVKKHQKFVGNFSKSIEKTLSDFWLELDSTYAKLSFVAKMLQDADVIKEYKEVGISVEGTTFNRSIALYTHYGTSLIYMLNYGRSVFVYEGIAVEHPGNLSFLVWFQNDQTKKYSNVLSDNFDWKEFALYVVDVIHKSSYRRKEVIDNAIG